MKSWVQGYQRNRKGWYLPSEEIRALLFPKAAKTSVYGVLPLPVENITLDERMDVSGDDVTAEDESILLQEDDQGESGGEVASVSVNV